MATVFSTLYHAFCPLRSLKSFQLPFCCLGFIERKETHSPDLIWEEQSPPEAFFLFPHSSVFPLQNSSLLFCFQPHIAWVLLCSSSLSPLVWHGVRKGANMGFITGCHVWLLVGNKSPVAATREAASSFTATARGRLSRDSTAIKSS